MGAPRKHLPIDKTCPACGTVFHCVTHYAILKQEFCSRACRTKVHGNGRLKERTPRDCKTCGKQMMLLPCHLPTRFYCSSKCRSTGTASQLRGPNSGTWQGGSDKYWKRQARIRDNYTCQFPGCGFYDPEGNSVHAHHKIPARSGGSDELPNLVSLCAKHHREVERRLLLRILRKHPAIVQAEVALIFEDLTVPEP